MAFPASLPSYTITAGSETANGAGGGTGLSGLLNAFEVDITALGTKMGTGASTPASGQVLRSSGAGTSVWGQVVITSDVAAFSSANLAGVVTDETGSGSLVFANSPTIVTPTVASFTNAQHNHSNAAGGGQIGNSGLTSTAVNQNVVDWTTAGGIWWQELGRTTLGVAGDTITVNFTARKYLRVIFSLLNTGGAIANTMRFNNDASAVYSRRDSTNGGADGTGASLTEFLVPINGAYPQYGYWEIINILAQEKLGLAWGIGQNTAGAANLPIRVEVANKWANTAAQITRVDVLNTAAGDYAIGSEVIVLGHD